MDRKDLILTMLRKWKKVVLVVPLMCWSKEREILAGRGSCSELPLLGQTGVLCRVRLLTSISVLSVVGRKLHDKADKQADKN